MLHALVNFCYRKPAHLRDPRFHALARKFIQDNPRCIACGTRLMLQCHHRVPVHVNKSLELDPANYRALCMFPGRACHFHIGHCGTSWMAWNPNVDEDAAKAMARRRRKVKPHALSEIPHDLPWVDEAARLGAVLFLLLAVVGAVGFVLWWLRVLP